MREEVRAGIRMRYPKSTKRRRSCELGARAAGGSGGIETTVPREKATDRERHAASPRCVASAVGRSPCVALGASWRARRSAGAGQPRPRSLQRLRERRRRRLRRRRHAERLGVPPPRRRRAASGSRPRRRAAPTSTSQVALSAPTTTLTDGIWACVETAPAGGARRIRSWLSGATSWSQMRPEPSNRQLQVIVNGVRRSAAQHAGRALPGFLVGPAAVPARARRAAPSR